MEKNATKSVCSNEELEAALKTFKLEELEARLEMSDFANPSPPAKPPEGDNW